MGPSAGSVAIYIDGASLGNPGPAGIGVVFMGNGRTPIRQLGKPVGETTNNVAEYLALLYALQEAVCAGCRTVSIRTDSELLARQMNGQYRVRDRRLRLLYDLAVHLRQAFQGVRIEHVPREENRLADRLAGEAARASARQLGAVSPMTAL